MEFGGVDPSGVCGCSELPRTPLPFKALYASKASSPMVIGDIPPEEPPVLAPPRGPFLIPLRTSDKPMAASLIEIVPER